ncbi:MULTISPECIES: ABC transporter substrate-binding protein [Microbacterium]|uniref:ABC transporter substrate-binding protein n=1 Tax=Microbacterium TaxID=33882 RepID=UPI00217ED24C|nr:MULTISPECIES: ABC transporter substrate-binding protein [Microbacterium]UWF77467.1 carbohydrate ABC transporter substrate-binding protein [Microbacterium neungamense]WCM55630.1 carbohydrate ABC transporter substrate-binding protein [Microbacterium sp. EF45047]
MKHPVAALALISVTGLALTACTGGGSGGDEVSLEVQTNFGSTDPSLDVLQEITDRYLEEHPGVAIDLVPSTDTYEADVKVRLASGDVPDIWATHGWSLLRYAEFLEPLDGQPWAENFNEALAPAMKDEDGRFYALPIETDVAGIVYNAEVLESAGIDPASLTDWDAFGAALQKLKDAGVIPISSSGKDSWFAGNITDFIGSGDFSEEAFEGFKDGTFDEAGYTRIMEMIDTWRQNGYFNPDYSSATMDDLGRSLAEGKTAFIFVQNYLVATALEFNPVARIAYMPIPSQTGQPFLVGGEGRAYGVAKDSPDKEQALDYLAFLAEPENLGVLAASIGGIPGLTNAESDLGVLTESYETFVAPGEVPLKPYFDRVYLPNGIWDTMVSTTDGVITGQMTPADAVAQMKSSFDSLQ